MDFSKFEEFSIEKALPFDEYCHGKRIALIAAPIGFDVSKLQGHTLIDNGISLVNVRRGSSEDDIEHWDIHSEDASDINSNVFFPSGSHEAHCLAAPISLNVNVMQSLNIPEIKYPKISKKTTRLPKPENLRARWKPFGNGTPCTSNISSYSSEKVETRKKDKHSIQKLDLDEIDALSRTKTKKKKHKENRKIDNDDEENFTASAVKKTKSKKKDSKTDDSIIATADEKEEEQKQTKKKSKKNLAKFEESELDSTLETRDYRRVKTKKKPKTSEEDVKTPKSKVKKHKMGKYEI